MHNYYFLGIGGIGMSALARYLHREGHLVSGYDKTPTPLTEQLQKEGISIYFDEAAAAIPEAFTHPEKTLVIRTPAVPMEHKGYCWFRDKGFTILKRAALLGSIVNDLRPLCVAGTHGKTTTSSLLAWLLHASDVPMAAFLGGIPANFKTNYMADEDPEFAVVEADEFDRSFMHLRPYMAILTAVDPDHLDIYGTGEELQRTYQEFAQLVHPNGMLVMRHGLPITPVGKVVTYGIEKGDVQAREIQPREGGFAFQLWNHHEHLGEWFMPLPGAHNVENALAAITVARACGASLEALKMALKGFTGVARRMEKVAAKKDLVYYDDYAHHPAELTAAITALRTLYPDRTLTGIFQPHLFSRTQDFAEGFAASLSLLDHVVLMNIYPAREKPIPGVTSAMLLEKIKGPKTKILADTQTILEDMLPKTTGVLVTLGAGDIDRLVPAIRSWIQHQQA